MAKVDLGRAELALFSNPASTLVVIPSLSALTVTDGRDRVALRYLGDTFPTGHHGEGRDHRYALTCRYPRKNHDGLLALQRLLDEVAPAAADKRLLLRTHVGLAVGLDVAVAVEVDGLVTRAWAAAVVDVSFTVQVVQHSLEV